MEIKKIESHGQKVSEVGTYDGGTATETLMPLQWNCPYQELQINLHTHPLSGITKFSYQDAAAVVPRLNEVADDGHCVLGLGEFLCVFGVKGKNLGMED